MSQNQADHRSLLSLSAGESFVHNKGIFLPLRRGDIFSL